MPVILRFAGGRVYCAMTGQLVGTGRKSPDAVGFDLEFTDDIYEVIIAQRERLRQSVESAEKPADKPAADVPSAWKSFDRPVSFIEACFQKHPSADLFFGMVPCLPAEASSGNTAKLPAEKPAEPPRYVTPFATPIPFRMANCNENDFITFERLFFESVLDQCRPPNLGTMPTEKPAELPADEPRVETWQEAVDRQWRALLQ